METNNTVKPDTSLSSIGVDVIEDVLQSLDDSVFRLLLKDKTTKNNIIWATNDYG